MSFGPGSATLLVNTYREGVAARAGHDLVIEVTRWTATVDGEDVIAEADPRSLAVREGRGGVKPLSDRDRAEIVRTIEAKVLGGDPISFRGHLRESGGGLELEGDLTMAGATRPVRAALARDGDRVRGTIPLIQSRWGIKPYRGMMGALKVRDEVEVVVDAPL